MKYYDKNEKILIEAIENDNGWRLADNQDGLKKLLIDAAAKEKKSSRITINIDTKDLEKVKVIAKKEGLPYQTFLRSAIHKLAASH